MKIFFYVYNKNWNNSECIPNRIYDPQYFQCPSKSCQNNLDCWVPYGSPKACVCDAYVCGQVCVVADSLCSKLLPPKFGSVTVNDRVVGSAATYSCLPGYFIKGAETRYCLATFNWSDKPPVCTNRSDLCASPPRLQNADPIDTRPPELKKNDFKIGDSITILCKKGFSDPNYKQGIIAKCLRNQWTYPSLNCKAVHCTKLSDLPNGRVVYPGKATFTYLSKAFYLCNDGYVVDCDNPNDGYCERTCNEQGQWTGTQPTCKEILCPKLEAPANGSVQGFWRKVNSIATFQCKKGFQLVGSKFQNCQDNGKWDNDRPKCILRHCSKPPDVFNAISHYKSTVYNSTVIYTCLPHSTISGESNQLKCDEIDEKSLWLPQPPPQCLKHCHYLVVKNAKVEINSGKFKDSNEMVPHAVTASVMCESGYKLDIPKPAICKNGTWIDVPQCLPAPCSTRPPTISNGIARFYSLSHNSIARYFCYPGYSLNTSQLYSISSLKESGQSTEYAEMRCLFGKWKGQIPVCKILKCNRPEPPHNGMMYIKQVNGKLPFISAHNRPRHNDVLEYDCRRDQRLIGPKHAVCLSGRWSPPETPICQPILHDVLPLEWLFYSRDSISMNSIQNEL